MMEKAAEARLEDYQALLLAPQFYRSLGDTERELAARKRGLERARRRLELSRNDHRALYLGVSSLWQLGEEETAREWARRAHELRPTTRRCCTT